MKRFQPVTYYKGLRYKTFLGRKKRKVDFNNVLRYFLNAQQFTNRFAGNIKCEDCHWGTLNKGNVNPFGRNQIDGRAFSSCKLNEQNIIVIVAESPHIYEYKYKNGQATSFKSPLYKNEKKIREYLKQNSNGWFDNSKNYDVVLMNAIQYQCSFGLRLWGDSKNQQQKKKVFEYAWKTEPCKEDLISRVRSCIKGKNEVIIINACTKNLKPCCNSNLFSANNNKHFYIYEERHPSTW